MSNTILATIHNHYMTAYSPRKSDARLDNHNRSELKNICNNILKLNKETPLYLYDKSAQTAGFAMALKEDTRQLQHTIINTIGKSKENDLFKNKVAFSSNTDIATARFVGKSISDFEESTGYELEVHSLASPQVNSGYLLPKNERDIKAGEYSFDVTINNMAYEFQFGVTNEDTNYSLQCKLARLFNHANIGLNASVVETEGETSALRISTTQTGNDSEEPKFIIQNTSSDKETDIVDYLGIDYISTPASNAYFTINGQDSSTDSNQFTIDKTFEITLNGVTGDDLQPVTIGVKANIDSLKDNVYHLIGGYNTFLKAADEYKTLTSSNKLTYEMLHVARSYQNELDSIGINITPAGSLSVDDHLLTQTAQSEDAPTLLTPLKDFSSSLFEKSEVISRAPLDYANKKIVAYKNPGKNFTSPYASSSYSGLLFNYYC